MSEVAPVPPQVGVLVSIGVSPARRAAVVSLTEVAAEVGRGLVGDHHGDHGGDRQVTLIQAEHLPVIAALIGRDTVEAGVLRRNLVVGGVNLLALVGRSVCVGPAVLEITGLCEPCARMDEGLGAGTKAAMWGHGGVTASVVQGGTLRCGDAVRAVR